MRIAILSRGRMLYSTRRLAEVGRKRNHDVRVIDPHRCVFGLVDGALNVEHEGLPLDGFDVVIPRVGTSGVGHTLSLIRHFESLGIPCLNGSRAIARGKNKLRAHQILSSAGLPVPRTYTTRDLGRLDDIVMRLDGPPVVIKITTGTQGVGVIVAESIGAVRSTVHTLWNLDQDVILQEYVKESAGTDVRILVVGDRVIGAMRREAADGDFRANLHRGGVSEFYDISDELAGVAVEAARALDLDIAGVDVLESDRGPLILEANSSPGLQGIEKATGVDIARAIIKMAEAQVRNGSTNHSPPNSDRRSE